MNSKIDNDCFGATEIKQRNILDTHEYMVFAIGEKTLCIAVRFALRDTIRKAQGTLEKGAAIYQAMTEAGCTMEDFE